MDMLSQRYACPFLILDDFIRLNDLHNFTEEILSTIAKERIHDARWEYYLHKVFDNISFEEYVKMCERKMNTSSDPEMSNEEIGKVLEDSKKLLDNFTM